MMSGMVQSRRSVMRTRLPKTRSSSGAGGFVDPPVQPDGWRGVAGEGPGEHVAHVLPVGDLVDGGFELGAGAAGSPAGEGVLDPVQLAPGFGEGLVQPAGLASVQLVGVGEHAPVGKPEGLHGRLVGAQSLKGGDQAVVGAGDGEQVRAV
jgi:hypothetical protein